MNCDLDTTSQVQQVHICSIEDTVSGKDELPNAWCASAIHQTLSAGNTTAASLHDTIAMVKPHATKERKEKFTLFGDHNGSLLRQQPGAMTRDHSPKGKESS